MSSSITDIRGIRVGHAQDAEAQTGCTAIIVEKGAAAGMVSRGTAPASRETTLLSIDGITREIHAVFLTGGSAFGLDAAAGVMSYLEENEIGFDAGVARVPLVPTLSLFDLTRGRADVRPDPDMAYLACSQASTTESNVGSIGAGAGATVGKLTGMENCAKSGIGTISGEAKGVKVGVLTVCNAFGDIINAEGSIVAGATLPGGRKFLNSSAHLKEHGLPLPTDSFANCTFAVVATDMRLNRRDATILAEMASAGLARGISPAHSIFDFDAVIAMGCGNKKGDLMAAGTLSAELVHESLIRGVQAGKG